MLINFFQTKWATMGLGLAVGFLLLSLIKLQPEFVSVRKEIKNVDQKIAEIERGREEVERLGDYLRSPAYLEKQARIKLNYKKPGEEVVYVYTTEAQNKKETQKSLRGSKILDSKFITNLRSWWGYLIN